MMNQAAFTFEIPRRVYTVSALTQEIRNVLEPKFLDVWVMGEVSNFRAASSGHCYFTLKDESAQLRVVCFRNQARYLKFRPQDGVSLTVRGRLSLYEARGEYQIIAEYLEPAGLGALQLAFEQLKQKLAAEGLFDPARRKPLPILPSTIGVVTSPTGAVIRDILRVLKRRFPNINVMVYAARVQGEAAAEEIAAGIRHFNRNRLADVLILARGGGSLEDLWPFNEESLARAIAASEIPVISAVGHETDFTIADFVADLRAPTPSAAAEMVVARKQDFGASLRLRERQLAQAMGLKLYDLRQRLTELALHRVFQTMAGRLAERSQRLDELGMGLERAARGRLGKSHERWLHASAGILRVDWQRILDLKRARLTHAQVNFHAQFVRTFAERRNRCTHLHTLLRERNPLAILGRGYSVARDLSGKIIRDAEGVVLDSEITIRLARGELGAIVRSKKA
ncbi:MAG: exodeoxyribonuclease VII large subunit [Terriglobia bacterium]